MNTGRLNLPVIFAGLLAGGVMIGKGARMFAGTFNGTPADGAGQAVEELGQAAAGSLTGAPPMPQAHGPRAVWLAARELASAAPAYVLGGGHGSNALLGADCSGAVSYVLNRAGLLTGSLTSGGFMSYGDAGPGQHVTIYANPTHVLMEVDGHFFGTSGFGHPGAPNRTGANWFTRAPSAQYLSQFTVRHPAGM